MNDRDDTCAPEINASTPQRLDQMVGNALAREQVGVTVAACKNDRRPFPHSLICSQGPGQGKTLLSKLIANEMNAPCYREVLGQTVTSVGMLNGILMDLDDHAVLLIDEIHTLDPAEGQHALLRVLEDGKVFVGQGRKAKAVDLPSVTVIGATTEEYALIEPLRNRFRLNLRLGFLSVAEIADLLRRRATDLNWEVEDDVFGMVAARARGTPRVALRLLESVRRTSRSEDAARVRVADVERTARLEGLDHRGLTTLERDYLRILHDAGVAVRLNVLSTKLNLPNQTLVKLVEPYLLREGMILKTEQGRELTPAGIEHMRSVPNE